MAFQAVDLQCRPDGFQVGQVKTFQFAARNAHQTLALLAGLAAGVEQSGFDGDAIRVAVQIAQHDEARLRVLIIPNLARQLLFEILLALERNTPKPDGAVQYPGQQFVQHGLGGRLFQQKNQLLHRGSAPSKKPCFHSSPSGSPPLT